jgi:hypothetical protein
LSTGPAIAGAVLPLLASVDHGRGIRLLGVSAGNFAEPVEQLSLDDLFAAPPSTSPAAAAPAPSVESLERAWHDASSAIDEVRSRFGAGAIGVTSALTRGPAGHRAAGAQPWGPDAEPDGPGDHG